MDYGTLAQLSNPGQNPIAGPGIVDIQAYRNYQNLATMREQALQKAMPLADMNAQQEAQKNKEFMMGSQGREDMVNLANMKAKNAPATYTRDKLTGDLEHAVKDQDLRNKLAEATENISGDADAYINGDEKLKQAVIDKNRGKRMRNGYVIGDNPEEDHKIFTVAGAVRKYKPELVNKQEVAKTAADAKIKGVELTVAGQAEVQKLRAKAAVDLQAAKAAVEAGKPLKDLTPGQREALVVAHNFKDDPIGEQQYWYMKGQVQGSVAIAAGNAATARGVLGGEGLKPQGPIIQQPPTPNPSPDTPSPVRAGGSSSAPVKTEKKEAPSEYKVDSIYVDSESGARAKYKGKDANGNDIWETVRKK